MLIKVRAEGEQRAEVKRAADIFRGQVVDATSSAYTVQLTGTTQKLEAFIDAVGAASVLEVVQYSPTQFELIGKKRGVTSMSIWYGSSVKTSTSTPPSGPAHIRKPLILRP